MLRVSLIVTLGLFVLAPTTSVEAGWRDKWQACAERTKLDWHRNNCWPQPFREIDRRTVCTVMATQIGTGWKRQNTLSDVYFDIETQLLNEAGRRKVWSIVASTPEPYRAIYVVQATSKEAQDRRMSSVERVAAETNVALDGGSTLQVVSVKIPPRSWPADYIDAIGRKAQAAIPIPVLPNFIDTTAGGG